MQEPRLDKNKNKNKNKEPFFPLIPMIPSASSSLLSSGSSLLSPFLGDATSWIFNIPVLGDILEKNWEMWKKILLYGGISCAVCCCLLIFVAISVTLFLYLGKDDEGTRYGAKVGSKAISGALAGADKLQLLLKAVRQAQGQAGGTCLSPYTFSDSVYFS